MDQIFAWTDGAARGNPGPAAIAWHIEGLGEKEADFGATIGRATNNQAEYQALIACLEYLTKKDISGQEVVINSDSELMVKQINGDYRVKNDQIRVVFQQAQELIELLRQKGNRIHLQAVLRSKNRRADELANKALDGSPTDAPPLSATA